MAWDDFVIKVEQNATYKRKFAYVDGDGNAFNFTGCVVKLRVREGWPDTSAQILQISSSDVSPQIAVVSTAYGDQPAPAYPNAIEFEILPAQTAAMTMGDYFYDLLVIFADGEQIYALRGDWVVLPTGAR